ncbi:hypothetical protein SMAX5B_007228 [Scophthalmus maximus]|uniref:FAM13A-like domain-containing protein n=1 Tax=Scophthalmus maximus TaxID=52904 RepID=A0A2U9CNK5_SCOMX|nr:hypothetical protein SMAX5B_007228 [Scophthalmus maximus]
MAAGAGVTGGTSLIPDSVPPLSEPGSSLLKLQALEGEGGTSLGPSPEESPPALGSKEQKSPRSPEVLVVTDVLQVVQVVTDVPQVVLGVTDVLQEVLVVTDVLQEVLVVTDVLQEVLVVTDVLQVVVVVTDILQEVLVVTDVLQEALVVTDVLQEVLVVTDVLQVFVVVTDVLQVVIVVTDILQEVLVVTDVLQEVLVVTDVLQEALVVTDVLQEVLVVTDVLQEVLVVTDVLQEVLVVTDVLQVVVVVSDVLQVVVVVSDVLQEVLVVTEVLQEVLVVTDVLQVVLVVTDVLQVVLVVTDLLQAVLVVTEVFQVVLVVTDVLQVVLVVTEVFQEVLLVTDVLQVVLAVTDLLQAVLVATDLLQVVLVVTVVPQLLAGGPAPLPSPRCSSLSLRFNSDPDTAPSPPCSQQSRGRGDRTEGSEDQYLASIPFLTRQIQALKKKVRRFEDQFEQEMNYKPSHNDKYSNPEMISVMSELAKARKQLKELRLRQSVFESKEQDGPENTDICRYVSGQQGAGEHKPTVEETVESLFRRLREKRRDLGLPDNMEEMTQAQMVLEKITLQKCLLYCESLHGRPGTRQEKNLVKPLYDRYQMIKRLLCASPPIPTIEEEDGSDEDSMSSVTVGELPLPLPPRPTRPAVGEEDSDRDSDPAFVSPIDEVKSVRQQPVVATANLHELSRYQLLQSLRETRAEKKSRRKALREFEEQFYRQTGRICQKEDRTAMKEEYQEYKQLKAKLRLLEVLLSKQDVGKTL